MPTRKRRVGPEKKRQGTQIVAYGAESMGRVFYGNPGARDKALRFVRDAAGKSVPLPAGPRFAYSRRAELARAKLEYLGLNPNVGNPDRKFAALKRTSPDAYREANTWAKQTVTKRRPSHYGEGKMALQLTYPHPDGGFRTLNVGPATLGRGSVTFRARDFLQLVKDQGGLWEACAYMFNAELEAEKYPFEVDRKPAQMKIVSGAAVNYEAA